MSVFDKDTFLNQQTTGASETKYTPVPENEYAAYVDEELGLESYKDPERGEVPILVVGYVIMDEKLKEDLGLSKIVVQDRVFLDMEKDGALAFGPNKNVRLGKIREAVNQNDAKKAWNFNMLRGAGPVLIKVTHRFAKNGDGPFANVDRIARGQ